MPRVVLITGCSSGIGRATALALAGAGDTVYATARRLESVQELAVAGCRTLALDVTSEASMQAAVAAVERAEGRIDVLINNAGYSQSGAVESVSIEQLRTQLETNVVGVVRLIQLVAPGMRSRGAGRIINLGSVSGLVTFPGGGAYHASKFALHALSDALRFELSGFGIQVVLIEPGLIRTGFGAALSKNLPGDDAIADYASFNRAVEKKARESYVQGPLSLTAIEAEAVARVIQKSVTARRPRARYATPTIALGAVLLRRLLPDFLWDALLRTQFPLPRRAEAAAGAVKAARGLGSSGDEAKRSNPDRSSAPRAL